MSILVSTAVLFLLFYGFPEALFVAPNQLKMFQGVDLQLKHLIHQDNCLIHKNERTEWGALHSWRRSFHTLHKTTC